MELINLFGIEIEKDDIAFAAILQDVAENIGRVNDFVKEVASKKVKNGDKKV